MTEIRISKTVYDTKDNPSNFLVIEYWNLRFICDLVLVIWDF